MDVRRETQGDTYPARSSFYKKCGGELEEEGGRTGRE